MNEQVFADGLSQTEISFLRGLKRRIKKLDVYAMEAWATFFAFDHPELVTGSMAKRIVLFYKLAVRKKISRAMLNLGAIYYNGVIVRQDFAKALNLYEMAANSGDPVVAARAVSNLGYCYYYGRSVAVDKEKAFSYFLGGVQKYNDPNCLYKLGDMYRYGECIEKDERKAYDLYRKAYAADESSRDFCGDILLRLGECELCGVGTEQDVVSAKSRFALAETDLCERLYIKKDPFAKATLAKVKKLMQTAERLMQEENG